MKTRNFLLLGLALLFSFQSCKKDDDGGGNLPDNVVVITEDIDQVTTWSGDKVYLIKAWDFYVNNTLTIQPGAVIKFHPTAGPDLSLGGSGTIVASGTLEKPIIFTSYKDDAHGGDTNGDGTGTNPAPEDWGEINTNGLNGSVFEYCEFYYGGSSAYTATLGITSGSNATVRNCTFAYNSGDDGTGWYGALDASGAGSGTVIQNNVFYENVRPLSINTEYNLNNSNQFHNPANAIQTNTYNGIFVYTYDFGHALSWGETEVPYIIDDNDWWINSTGSLSLANNVVVKFRPGSTLLLESGLSALVNYNGTGVYFTSYKDDAHGGDTNGDMNATTPSNGDWNGIYNDVSSVYVSAANILYDSH